MGLKFKSITAKAIILMALIALFAGFFVGQHFKKKMDMSNFNGTFLENPRPINQFHLTGMDGKVFDNNALQGSWTIMFFGFTSCGYVCPTTLAELAKMYRILESKKITMLPRIVMISIDPERDTQEKLAHYVTSFHKNFYGVVGDDASIKSMSREMGIVYAKVTENNEDPKSYDIQHSAALVLFNPRGELNAFFTTPHQANSLAKDYLLLTS